MDCMYPVGGFRCHGPPTSSGSVSPVTQGFFDAGRCHWKLDSPIRSVRRSTGDAGYCCWALASQIEEVPRRTGGRRKIVIEKLWREFFSDPSEWWDQRLVKRDSRHPDFKHKKRRDGLFVIDFSNPPWVDEKLAALPPGSPRSRRLMWNKKLTRFIKAQEYEKALKLFHQMQLQGIRPDKLTFVSVLNACVGVDCLEEGKHIHNLIVRSGLQTDVFVANALVDMYAKFGSIEEARIVFNKIPVRNVLSWIAMIQGYVNSGQMQKALKLSQWMSMLG